MILINISKWFKLEHLILLPILGLAFYIAFIPHLHYPYPMHVDEWIHLTRANAILQAGDTTFVEPLFGKFTFSPSSNLEGGFQLFWGAFQQLSGISWLTIFRYFPSIIFMLTVLAVYVLARRQGFGWEAAFFTSLIPTTVGILGPAFLVPVTMGLIFTPLILFLAFNFKTIRSYLLILIFITFLMTIHPPSAVLPILVLTPYILLNIRGNFKHSLGLIVTIALPFLLIIPWTFNLLLPTAKSLLTPQSPTQLVQLPRIIQLYGYLPIIFSLLGSFLLTIKGGRQNYGLALGLLAVVLMLATFYTLHYGVAIVYERGLMYLMLMVGIVAGGGLMAVKNLRLPSRVNNWLKTPIITQNIGRFLCLIIIAITLVITIPNRLNTRYYHMIDTEDYQTFVWIKDNIGQEYKKAILDPWKATAFTAITGKSIYSRIHFGPTPTDLEAYAFLKAGSDNTSFLEENEISLIYTRIYDAQQGKNIDYPSDNPNLVKIAKNIYLLKESRGKR